MTVVSRSAEGANLRIAHRIVSRLQVGACEKASGADYLGDAFGASLALLALRLSRRRQDGHATSVAALVNVSLLLAVTLAVMVEAIYRLSTGAPSIHGALLIALVVAVHAIKLLHKVTLDLRP